MPRKKRDPEAPEVLEAILQRIRNMTREELQQAMSWRPEGVEETWRMQRTLTAPVPTDGEGPPSEADGDVEPASSDEVAATRSEVAGQ